MGLRLETEIAAARVAGGLSRLAGRGGGTTLPGKLLWALDPPGLETLATAIPEGVAVVSGTNGKTTTTAMVARMLGPEGLAWNNSGANLASGVASTLIANRRAERALLEIDEFALPQLLPHLQPRAVLLCNLFRDQLDRYGELEHIAERWRTAIAPSTARLVVNADDPLVASLAESSSAIRFGIDDPSVARSELQHAADSKYCVQCGHPYVYAAAYVGHLGDYACPQCGHARGSLDIVAREITLDGLDAAAFTLHTPIGDRRIRLELPGLYNVYNATAAASLAVALDVSLDRIATGLEGFRAAFGRFERVALDDRSLVLLLIKNPAGANEAVRTLVDGGVPPILLVALNDAVADGRDVSWIWDVDFEPLLAAARHVIVSGERAEELALRFIYSDFPEERLEVVTALEPALDRALDLVGPGGQLAVLPTYTAMLALRHVLTGRGHVRPFWDRERAQ